MKFVIGVDEVGRGPLAGPVAVGAVLLPKEKNDWKHWEGLRDSKKLSEKKREEWFEKIIELEICYSVKMLRANAIDRKGIVQALRRVAESAIGKLELNNQHRGKASVLENVEVLCDKGLSVPEEWKQEQIVKGDEKEPVIALASIVAKVTRDKYMIELAKKHPEYGFEKHKGYGTKAHREAIKKHGQITGIHRKTFIHC